MQREAEAWIEAWNQALEAGPVTQANYDVSRRPLAVDRAPGARSAETSARCVSEQVAHGIQRHTTLN